MLRRTRHAYLLNAIRPLFLRMLYAVSKASYKAEGEKLVYCKIIKTEDRATVNEVLRVQPESLRV